MRGRDAERAEVRVDGVGDEDGDGARGGGVDVRALRVDDDDHDDGVDALRAASARRWERRGKGVR